MVLLAGFLPPQGGAVTHLTALAGWLSQLSATVVPSALRPHLLLGAGCTQRRDVQPRAKQYAARQVAEAPEETHLVAGISNRKAAAAAEAAASAAREPPPALTTCETGQQAAAGGVAGGLAVATSERVEMATSEPEEAASGDAEEGVAVGRAGKDEEEEEAGGEEEEGRGRRPMKQRGRR